MTKTWRLKKRTCGKLWGRPARRPRTFEGDAQGPCMSSVQLLSARRRTFEHCTSCCPSRDATVEVLTKKKKKKKKKKRQTPQLTTPRKRSVEGRCQRWKRDLLSSPQFGGGYSESTSQQTTKQPPGPQLQAQLEKVASTSLATIGARSSFSGARLAHEFPRSFLVAAIIFPHTKWLKKITDYRDTPALTCQLRKGIVLGVTNIKWFSEGESKLKFGAELHSVNPLM